MQPPQPPPFEPLPETSLPLSDAGTTTTGALTSEPEHPKAMPPQVVIVMAFSIRYGEDALRQNLANDLEPSCQNALTAIANQLESQGALIENMTQQASRHSLFATFVPPVPDPGESIESLLRETADYAAQNCLVIVQAFQKQYAQTLILQTGLDIDMSSPRNPFIATPERMTAPAQGVAVSHRFLQLLSPSTPYLELSTVSLGDQAIVCYQLLGTSTIQPEAENSSPESLLSMETVSQTQPVTIEEIEPLQSLPSITSPTLGLSATSETPELLIHESSLLTAPMIPDSPVETTTTLGLNASQEIASPVETPQIHLTPEAIPTPPEQVINTEHAPLEVYEPDKPEIPPTTLWMATGPIRPSNSDYESAIQVITDKVKSLNPQRVTSDSETSETSTPEVSLDTKPLPPSQRLRKPQCLQLIASDGVGKSNILQVARLQADPNGQDAIWLGANAYRSQADGLIPFGLWLELFQNFFGLPQESLFATPEDGTEATTQATTAHSQEASIQAIDTVLQSIFIQAPVADISAPLKPFLGLAAVEPLSPESRQHAARFEHAIARLFEGLSQQKPVVVVLEDIQYSDPLSLKLLVHLLEGSLANLPIFFVVTMTRDAYPQGDLAELLTTLQSQVLVVSELNEAEITRFLEHGPLAGHYDTFPHDLLQPLTFQSRGITLYLEEGLRLLHGQGLLELDPETGKYRPAEDAKSLTGPVELPTTLQAVILARLQLLPEPVARVLQWASVLGERFAIPTLSALCQLDSQTFDNILRQLWEQGFILPDGGNSGRFRHGLLWKVVWNNTPADYRSQLLTDIAQLYTQTIGQPSYAHPAKIVHFATQAQDADMVFNSTTFSAAYYGGIGAITVASHYLQLAMSWLPHSSQHLDTAVQMRLRENLGILNVDMYPEFAIQQLEPMVVWARHQSDIPKLVEAAGYLVLAHEKLGRYASNAALLQDELLPLIQDTLGNGSSTPIQRDYQPTNAISRHASDGEISTIWSLQATLLSQWMHLGRYRDAQTLIQETLEPWGTQHFLVNNPLFVKIYLDIQAHKSTIALGTR